MRISASAEYAIRILTFMSYDKDKVYSVKYLHGKMDLPYKYITQLMTKLAKQGLVDVKQGRTGGFYLASALNQISAADIIYSTDDSDDLSRCILGFDECNDTNPCPMHNLWQKHKENILKTLENVTLEDLKKSRATKN